MPISDTHFDPLVIDRLSTIVGSESIIGSRPKWIKILTSSLISITAHVIFRVLMQGAPQKVIGLEPGNICEEMQIIDGIVIQPSLSCHVEDEAEPDVKME